MFKEAESMPKAKKRLEFQLDPLVDLIGMKKLLDKIGMKKLLQEAALQQIVDEWEPKKIIEELGLQKIIEEVGAMKVIDAALSRLTDEERAALKRQLDLPRGKK